MDERNEGEKVEEVMLPGFRFHPTDEELVGFYLKRKIQQRPLSIELIKQLDIYKYDPWDLPKLASTGEKEWYFYCPRDRKYRNSARPNRVTGAGFWKATGTDRPVYSSEGNKCIGLKKSLVFYKGRAAKGVKTEWMMHEFRLPSLIDSSSPNRFMDKNVPPSDSWAICKIFKKSPHSTAQRMAHHQSSHSQSPETYLPSPPITFDPTEPLTTTKTNGPNSTSMQQPICTDNNLDLQSQPSPLISTCPLDDLIASSYRTTLNPTAPMAFSENGDFLDLTNTSNGLLSQLFSLAPSETTSELLSTIDVSSILQNMSSSVLFGDFGRIDESVNSYSAAEGHPPYHDGFPGPEFPQQESTLTDNSFSLYKEDQHWETVVRTGGSGLNGSDAWKWSSIGGLGWWDNPSCPGELSTLFSTTKCYT